MDRQKAGIMKVFALSRFDQPPAVIDAEKPEPAAGEVRVRVHAASVNGFDLSVGKGYLQGMMDHRFPVVLGKDFAGTVDAVGPGVTEYEVGDRVFGVVTKDFLGDGSFGEYVTVPVSVGIAKLPEGVELTEAAGLGLAGTAAVNAFDAASISPGSTVLVVGATGGVGQQAVQLAAKAGATVIATAATTDEIELVTRLGAAQTVDYTGDVAEQVRELYPDGVDVVLHFAGPSEAVAPVVKSGGAFVSTMLRTTEGVAADGVQVTSIYAHPAQETLERIAQAHAAHDTSVTVQRTYPLDQAAQAFEDFAAGTVGKLVITIG